MLGSMEKIAREKLRFWSSNTHLGSVCSQKRHTLGVYAPRRDTPWKCMFPEETNLGGVCFQKRHTLGVYVHLGSICSQNRYILGVYIPRRETPWECMFTEETHLGSVCSQKRHSVGVYVLRRIFSAMYNPRADTRRKCMIPKHTLLANVYPEQRHGLGAYAPITETLWHQRLSQAVYTTSGNKPRECVLPSITPRNKCMSSEETHTKGVCLLPRHTSENNGHTKTYL